MYSPIMQENASLNGKLLSIGLKKPWPIRQELNLTKRIMLCCMYYALFPNEDFRVLRVIYNETVDPIVIVTAYFDDEVKDL